MKRITMIIPIMLLLLLAGCVTNNTVSDDAIIKFKTYGGFINPERAIQELTIDGNVITYNIFNSDNRLVETHTKTIDSNSKNEIIKLFNDNEFLEMKNLYERQEEQPIVADAGTLEISIIQPEISKTVKVDPYYEEYMPIGLQKIANRLQSLITYVLSTNEDDAKTLAENWIKDAPTYEYDGSNLKFVSYVVLESYPEQHALTYDFVSSHSGYGDRTGQILLQVITPHTIRITIVEGRIISAVIDDKWD